jgi:hypothetical protein
MTVVTQTLEDAIERWQELVEIEHELFQMPVETAPKNGKGNLWMFATDKRKVMAHVYEPEKIDKIFADNIVKLYETAYGTNGPKKGFLSTILGDKADEEEFRRTISFHNSVSLLIHELFHPLYCPDSTWTKDKEGNKVPGDQELIYQAIADGIKKATPRIKEADLVAKVKNVENAIWDFAIDTFQYSFISQNKGLAKTLAEQLTKAGYTIDGKVMDELPEGVIPIFDVVSYMKDDKLPKGLLSLNRFTYSLLFCSELETRKNLLNYFQPKIEKGGVSNIKDLVTTSLKGLVQEVDPVLLAQKRINPQEFVKSIDDLYAAREDASYDNTDVISTMTSLLIDKNTRYDAIRGFVKPLAHLIDVDDYEQRGNKGKGTPQPGQGQPGQGQPGGPQPGQGQPGQGESDPDSPGAGDDKQPGEGDISDVVDALVAGMTEDEASQFLQALAHGAGTGNNPYLAQLTMQGRDDYYKLHAPALSMETPDNEAVNFEQGKKTMWTVDYSVRVSTVDLVKHQKWINYGLRQNLPVIAELIPGQQYMITYFQEEEIDLPAHQWQDRGFDVARNWILINDSSGSMGSDAIGSGSRWDGLMHINYGEMKACVEASKLSNQPVDLWVVNFSSTTRVTGPVDLQKFYDAKSSKEKGTLLLPQHGGTTLNQQVFSKIKRQLKPGRTVWSIASDGDISNYTEIYSQIDAITQQPDQCVLYFDMLCRSTLGSQLAQLMSRRNNLQYKSIMDMKEILQSSLDVLIKYK